MQRLAGINRTRRLLLTVADGDTVLVKIDAETDRFGRLLRYVYLQDGTSVHVELVRVGFT